MARGRHGDPAFGLVAAGAGLACGGWAAGNALLAVAGVLVALTSLLSWAWGRWCLPEVTYTRRLDHARASFGERLGMEIEVVNDKLLPLAWLHLRDAVPPDLEVEGAVVTTSGRRRDLQLVLAMLPYQRVRRRVTVVCTERGLHRFGPADLRSGSPLGTHERSTEVRSEESLLVYPKVVPLSTLPLTSRVPLGERRVRQRTALDPTRVVGVRPYVTGDPVRSVDWRATARSNDLLVRVHEPTASPSVALFVELLPPRGMSRRAGRDMIELEVSVAASVASALLSDGVATGLYTTGTARGVPVAVPPSRDPGTRTAMLELLAQVTPAGGVPLPAALVRRRHRMGVSVLVIATDFPPTTCAALADVHRRSSVGALWVRADGAGAPPPPQWASWQVRADDSWRDWPVLELVER